MIPSKPRRDLEYVDGPDTINTMTNTTQRRRRSRGATLSIAVILFTACGGGDPTATVVEPPGLVESSDVDSETPTGATTTPVATVPSIGSATEGIPSTSAPENAAPVSTTVALPRPALLPLDDETPEPVVPLGSITIPAIGIDRPMFEGIRLPTFDLGPGHWPGTAMPGQIGNVVVGGHRTESHADFGDLDLLKPGDEVVFTDTTAAGFTYVVESTEIVDPFAAVIVNQTRAYTATLFACHPKGSTDQRIVVRLVLAA